MGEDLDEVSWMLEDETRMMLEKSMRVAWMRGGLDETWMLGGSG